MNIAAAQLRQEEFHSAKNNLATLITSEDFAQNERTLLARSQYHLARAYIGLGENETAQNALTNSITIYESLPSEDVSKDQNQQSLDLLESIKIAPLQD